MQYSENSEQTAEKPDRHKMKNKSLKKNVQNIQ